MRNAGQVDPSVRFYGQGAGYGVYLTQREAVLSFAPPVVSATHQLAGQTSLALQFVGANPTVQIEGQDERRGKVNSLIGSDPAKWRSGLPTYGEVVYRELWPGVDMVFHGGAGRLKYEFDREYMPVKESGRLPSDPGTSAVARRERGRER